MKKCHALCFAVFSGLSVWAADNKWVALDGEADGYWDAAGRWSLGHLPAANENAWIDANALAKDVVVKIPSGGTTVASALTLSFTSLYKTTFDVFDSVFFMRPLSGTEYYPQDPFAILFDRATSAGQITFLRHRNYENGPSQNAPLKITNARLSFRCENDDTFVSEFTGQNTQSGLFNFYDPSGIPNAELNTTRIFHADYYMSSNSHHTNLVARFDNVNTRFPNFMVFGYSSGPTYVGFSKGTHEFFGSLTLSGPTPEGSTVLDVKDGARLLVYGKEGSGLNLANLAEGRVVEVNVTGDGSYLYLTNIVYSGTTAANGYASRFFMNVSDGAVAEIDGEFKLGKINNLNICDATNIVSVTDATLNLVGAKPGIGQEGQNPNCTAIRAIRSSVNITNSSGNAVLQIRNGELNCTNSIVKADEIDIGYGTKANGRAVFSGGEFSQRKLMQVPNTTSGRGSVVFCDGVKAKISDCLIVGGGENSAGEFTVSGEDTKVEFDYTVDRHSSIGNHNNATGTFNVAGGEFSWKTSVASSRFNLGGHKNSVGKFNLSGGKCKFGGYGLGIVAGQGFITVSGGELDLPLFAVCTESNDAELGESVVRLTGGKVNVAAFANESASSFDATSQFGVMITANKGANRSCRLVLDGGVLCANRVAAGVGARSNGGTGRASFEADGGKIVANRNAPYMVSFFDEALLGDGGLTIDSAGFEISCRQNFADKAGEKGVLRLVGDGVKNLLGDDSRESRIEVSGGTLKFGPGAKHYSSLLVAGGAKVEFSDAAANGITALTLGDEDSPGYVVLKPGMPLAVSGPVELKNVRIELDGSFGISETPYSVIKSTEAISESSIDAWKKALVFEGLPEGSAAEFTAVETQGGMELCMKVRETVSPVIRVDEMNTVSNVTEDIVYGVGETLTTVVAEGSVLDIGGFAGYGSVLKQGLGKTVLSSPGNLFFGSFLIEGGILSFPSVSACGEDGDSAEREIVFERSAIEIGGEGACNAKYSLVYNTTVDATNFPVVVDNDADITVGNVSSYSGLLLKRGKGRLTFETQGAMTFGSSYYDFDANTQVGKNKKNVYVTNPRTVTFGSDGMPSDFWTTLTVAEGEMYFKGTGENASFSATSASKRYAAVYVGIPVMGANAQPGMVVDNATAELVRGNHFFVGYGCDESVCNTPSPYLVLTNGSRMSVTTFHMGRSAGAGFNGRVDVAASTLVCSEYFHSNFSGEKGGKAVYTFSDGAKFKCTSGSNHSITLHPNAEFRFNASSCQDNTADEKACWMTSSATKGGFKSNLKFENGSSLFMNRFKNASPLEVCFSFDNSRWNPVDNEYRFLFENAQNVTVEALEGGLVLDPGASQKWTFNHPVTGEGAIVKTGEGTLVFDVAKSLSGVTWTTAFLPSAATTNDLPESYTLKTQGGIDVREGKVQILAGAFKPGTRIAGEGKVVSSVLDSATVAAQLGDDWSSEKILTFEDTQFLGKTTVEVPSGLACEKPYPSGVHVASYSGAAPDVSAWRAKGLGEKLKGVFTASAGKILMDVKASGEFLIFVR